MQDFEKLGVFYLGREYDLASKALQEPLLLYKSKDLVTHAVVVGMTGSGKTGLCIGMIEEAAIDAIPAILIDPKGDLSNLLLTFPNLQPQDFLPWINAEDAQRKNVSPEEYAAQQAQLWTKGLADWGQDGARIQRLRDTVDLAIYTPGSSAGIPVSILASFAAPPADILDDGELLQERIQTTVTSLLGLLGIQADPLQSREHILLSNILANRWRDGQDVDLAGLIQDIQNPPLTKVGVLDLESFYPSKDRFALVMSLNNLLASPGFSAWLEGVPMDIKNMLYTPQGKPRIAIFSIGHLADAERMFFVSLLLNQVVGWMRTQSGTTSLRALLYMDEIYGYLPPSAMPPSKQPLLILLKQARAFGLGVVLATQNPVDLDYKALSNAGTWFIGRLQTERDKARVLDGLEGAAAGAAGTFSRQAMEQTLAGLGNRVFLMNQAGGDAPVIFSTRWVMSYLCGPLTRTQIKSLMDPYKARQAPTAVAAPSSAAVTSAAAPAVAQTAGSRPSLSPEIVQYFVPLRGRTEGTFYKPLLVGAARVHFTDTKFKIDTTVSGVWATPITQEAVPVDWETAGKIDLAVSDLDKEPVTGTSFAELPPAANRAKSYVDWRRGLVDWLYRNQTLQLFSSPSTRLVSRVGETEQEFRIRTAHAVREQRDTAVAALRKRYESRLDSLEQRLLKAQQTVAKQESQARQAQVNTAVTVGSSLLGALFGNRRSSTAINQAARGIGRSMGEGGDVGRAQESARAVQEQINKLESELEQEIAALESKMDPVSETLETIEIRPKKTNIDPQLVALTWAPYRRNDTGGSEPAW